jgi:hypothetical protein
LDALSEAGASAVRTARIAGARQVTPGPRAASQTFLDAFVAAPVKLKYGLFLAAAL